MRPDKHPFEYQAPSPEQTKAIRELREAYKVVYELLVADPRLDGRARALAITNLQQSSMWANAAVVFGE